MANYREIVTKTVLGKAKKTFLNHYSITPEEKPSTILGCWVINHNFEGRKENNAIRINGTSDVNIWYAYDNDTKTLVTKQTVNYNELLNVSDKLKKDLSDNSEIIIRSLREPTCKKVEIEDGKIEYDIEKELGIEVVGDAKVRIEINEEEDDWEDLTEEKKDNNDEDLIEENINEDFIKEKNDL